MSEHRFRTLLPIAALGLAVSAAAPVHAEGVVNVYTYRQPVLIEPLFNAFTEATGIKVQFVFADKGLIERLEQEGASSPADVLLTADVGRLVEATEKGLAQPVASAAIKENVPENLRDAGDNWFSLTMRARVIYASKERVSEEKMSYEDLADPKWKGKICTRSGQHPYNVELIAAVIAHKGVDATREWLKGVKANLARKPAGNDRAQAKGVFAGECDLAIMNTYYLGKMLTEEKEPEQKQWAESVRIIFPASDAMNTHVNVSGMLMTKNAPNKDNALKLMEYLASDDAQRIYAEANYEYPVDSKVPASELVRSWGTFTPDDLPISKLAELQKQASALVDEVQFDD
ncbi:MAG: Fe(3+) ABC transporter substrate-binding protein [Parvibaculaceae bacterium]